MAKPMIFYNPRPQFLNNTGGVVAGGKLFFYQPGTTTKKNTYTDNTLGTANPNPIILDSAGRPSNTGTPIDIYFNGSYKVVLAPSTDTDPPANAYWTVDNVTTISQQITTQSKSGNYTTVVTDRDSLILCDSTSASFTITLLPAATAGNGFVQYIKKTDSSAHTVTIQANAAETMDGSNTFIIGSQYDSIELISDGINWYLTQVKPLTITDTNGNKVLTLTTTASAVNYLDIANAATGNGAVISSKGTDTNIPITLKGKGTGQVNIGQSTSTATAITGSAVQLASDQPITDSANNEYLKFTKVASAVNEMTVSNNVTGSNPSISATGGDTNIGLDFQTKGSAVYNLKGTAAQAAWLAFYENTGNGTNKTTFKAPESITSDRVVTLPDADLSTWLVQRVGGSTTSNGTGSTTIPNDNTIPQITEGNEAFTQAITPKNTANILEIEAIVTFSNSTTNAKTLIMALFQDSTANALAATSLATVAEGASFNHQLTLKHTMTAGTVSATTFRIRVGSDTAGTIAWNTLSATTTQGFGGIQISSFSIKEYSA
jgi:hypothetical protein